MLMHFIDLADSFFLILKVVGFVAVFFENYSFFIEPTCVESFVNVFVL